MEKPLWARRDVSWLPIVSNEERALRRYIITSIFMASICSRIAQGKQSKPVPNLRRQSAAAIKVYPARGKRIRIVAGAKRTLVDLTDDISGCLELFDYSYPPPRKWKQPLVIRVIDIVRKDNKHYLALLTSAQSNCNVQGFCGAATDYTLIWLKLGAGLELEEKKSAVIEDCKSIIHLVDPGYDRSDETPSIKLVSGKLTIEYGNTIDDNLRTLTQLVYDGTFPEQGFVITTKEKKPQQEQ